MMHLKINIVMCEVRTYIKEQQKATFRVNFSAVLEPNSIHYTSLEKKSIQPHDLINNTTVVSRAVFGRKFMR